MKDALLQLVRTSRKLLKLDHALVQLGYDNSPYFEAYGSVTDAIYFLIGEKTELFSYSVTLKTIEDVNITDEECVEILLAEYKKNHT